MSGPTSAPPRPRAVLTRIANGAGFKPRESSNDPHVHCGAGAVPEHGRRRRQLLSAVILATLYFVEYAAWQTVGWLIVAALMVLIVASLFGAR